MSAEIGVLTSKVDEGGHVHQTAQVELANTTAVYEKYGNQYDEMDMDRMGKLQELRVSNTGSRSHQVWYQSFDISRVAELQVHDYFWLCCNSWKHLGICSHVRYFAPSRIRNTYWTIYRIIGISLSNGGTAGGIWMFLSVCFGMFFVALSMAEMASM